MQRNKKTNKKGNKEKKGERRNTNHKFFTKLKKKNRKGNVFCVITFESIIIQIYSGPQNDCLNFSFMKNIQVVGENIARKGPKMVDFDQYVQINFHIRSRKTPQPICS